MSTPYEERPAVAPARPRISSDDVNPFTRVFGGLGGMVRHVEATDDLAPKSVSHQLLHPRTSASSRQIRDLDDMSDGFDGDIDYGEVEPAPIPAPVAPAGPEHVPELLGPEIDMTACTFPIFGVQSGQRELPGATAAVHMQGEAERTHSVNRHLATKRQRQKSPKQSFKRVAIQKDVRGRDRKPAAERLAKLVR